MLASLLDRIGYWNPQLLRELKGRFKPRNVLLIVGLAVLFCAVLLFVFYAQLPTKETFYSKYCVYDAAKGLCATDAVGNLQIQWSVWWLDMFRTISWLMLMGLPVVGTYALAADLSLEEQRGTLNFVRLSPQSSRSILLGKALGVPSLFYFATLLILPLHWLSAIGGGVSLAFLISFYAVLAAGCAVLYSIAMLCGFLGKQQAGAMNMPWASGMTLVVMLFTLFFFMPVFIQWNLIVTWHEFSGYLSEGNSSGFRLGWFFLTLTDNAIAAHAFTLGNCAFIVYWLWQAMHRCFHSPTATLISKGQSYGLVTYCELVVLGFFGYRYGPADFEYWSLLQATIFITAFNLVSFLILIALLSPHRQSLLDWTRYRHLQTEPTEKRRQGRAALLADLVWGEKSPAVMAIAVNCAIVLTLVVALSLWVADSLTLGERLKLFTALVMSLNMVLIYSAIVQLFLLAKTKRRVNLATTALMLSMLSPVMVAALAGSRGSLMVAQLLMMSSPLPMIVLTGYAGSLTSMVLVIAGQWLGLTLLCVRLTQQLKQVGASASQPLLAGQPSLSER